MTKKGPPPILHEGLLEQVAAPEQVARSSKQNDRPHRGRSFFKAVNLYAYFIQERLT